MNPEEKKNQIRIWYIIARQIAAVSAVFTVILIILLVANYIQTRAVDPLNSKALNTLMTRLQENPNDTELKEQIRAVDLLARKAYFTHHWQIRTGNIMLFCFGLILVISLKYMSSLKLRLPDLSESPDADNTWENKFMARKYVMYGSLVIFIIAIVLGVMSEKAARSVGFAGGEVTDQAIEAAPPADLSAFDDIRKNWPSFRGPEGRGIALQDDPVTQWNGVSGENVIWKIPIPLPGYNSPVIWENKVFLSGGDRENMEVYCIDAMTGKILWKGEANDVEGSPDDMPEPSGDTGYAAATMATDGVHVFAVFATGDLACWDMEGKRIWAKNLGKPDNHYGHSSSLITYKDLLFVQFDQNSGGHLIAFKSASGELVYDKVRDVQISWASPILVNTGTRAEIILNSNPSVISYDPMTGAELWRAECMMGEVAPSPAYAEGMVYAVNDYARLVGIKIGSPAKIIWEYDDDLSEVSSPVVMDKFLIVPTSWGTVSCFNSKSGERYWYYDFDEGFYSSPVIVGDLVYLADMPGIFYIFKAAEEFELVGTCEMGERVVATPAFMHNRIYIRTLNHLFCIGDGQ